MQSLSRITRSRTTRAVAVWALVLVQAGFLWLGEFHRHDLAAVATGQPLCVLDGSRDLNDSPPVPFCVACQIGHEHAASPVVGRAPAAPAAFHQSPVALGPQFSPAYFHAGPSPRAPPAG